MLDVTNQFEAFHSDDTENRLVPTDCDLAVVAMSGGVDSSVAAVWMHELGIPSVGVSMQVWDYRTGGGSCSKATCCAPSDFNDARMVAAQYDIPYYVFDMEEVFKEKVIDRFVDEYYSGRTPNPCVECNNSVKFKELRTRGLTLGCSHVVTGHYARIQKHGSRYELHRGVDTNKDQSYFLYGVLEEELEYTVFPLGHLVKEQVRMLAERAGLSTASKPESQDICFVSGSVQGFVSKIGRRPEAQGLFVGTDGRILGTHTGVHNFTVGQRRGLQLGGFKDPLYVTALNAETQTVTVGQKKDLERESFVIEDMNWLAEQPSEFSAVVQVRSRHKGSPARFVKQSESKVEVFFEQEWVPVSPGQAGVIYCQNNSRVLGGGKIRV